MDAKVKEFLEKAQANEREKFEKERDALLISLGLIEGDAVSGREYGPRYGHPYVHYDAEKKAYYREIKGTPISVTDEEYEMIKKYVETKETQNKKDVAVLKNGAEKFLEVINIIVLIISLICSTILLGESGYGEELYTYIGIIVLLVSLIMFASVKVPLNISNNLHEINSKLN